ASDRERLWYLERSSEHRMSRIGEREHVVDERRRYRLLRLFIKGISAPRACDEQSALCQRNAAELTLALRRRNRERAHESKRAAVAQIDHEKPHDLALRAPAHSVKALR